jgi:hypothetical protein
MRQPSSVRVFSWFLGFALVCSLLCIGGCGEDMSQPKTITPEVSPADKAKASMEFFTKQMQTKGKGAAKKK